jgi:hypothetical protein
MGRRATWPAQFVFIAFRVESHMPRILFVASVFVAVVRSALGALVTLLGSSWDGPLGRYRPEDHYMRGPGPKWREKHFLDRASAGGT